MSTQETPDPYSVLQVVPGADQEVVRAAYRALARKHHPDAGGDRDRMAALNAAWHVVGHPERRAAYDLERRRPVRPAPYPPPQPGRPSRPGAATVLDFGRYTGWSIGRLAVQDPDYLRWLARTPIGRPLKAEIDAALAAVSAASAALRSPTADRPRRRFV